MPQFVIQRAPQNDEELWWAVLATWGVKIPRTKVCPHHDTPFEAFADAYFARHVQAMWLGSRGFSGKTFTMSLLGLTEMCFLGAFVSVLGGSGAQALRVQESMNDLWHRPSAPKGLLQRAPTKFDTYLTNGGKARTLMASQTSVRGPHPARLRIDECFPAGTMVRMADGSTMPIESVRVGMNLSTGIVVKSWCTGIRPTLKIRTTDGKEVQATANHPFCTEEGFTEAQGVVPGMRVATRQAWVGQRAVPRVLDSGTRQGEGSAQTCLPGLRCEGDPWVYDVPGVLPQATQEDSEFLRGLRRTTQAAGSQALSLMPSEVDEHNWRRTDGAGASDGQRSSQVEARSICGTAARPVRPGVRDAGSLWSFGSGFCAAERENSHRGARTILARQTGFGGTGQEETQDSGSGRVDGFLLAWGQPASLVDGLGWSEVASVEPATIEPVYNLTVEGSHLYEANDFLTHNCDEADLSILQAALGQPMRQTNQRGEVIETSTVFSSTHTYPDGPVTYYKREFAEKGLPTFSWCYKETSNPVDGWLDPDEIDRKRIEIPAQMWKNEYDILEPNFEGRALDEAAVERMFDPRWDTVKGEEGYYYQFLSPRKDRDYVTGVDWAKSRDYTVITTWDVTVGQWKMAAFEKINNRPWPVMIERLNKRWEMYGGNVVSDATGIGSVINDHLVFPKGVFRDNLTEVSMNGKVRTEMITEFVTGVEGDNFLAPRITSMYDDFRFVTADNLYNIGQGAHLPDTIASTALAWVARKRDQNRDTSIVSITRETSPWKI